MPDEVIETRDQQLDRIETELQNIIGLGRPAMYGPLEAFFDRPDMPERIAASGRTAMIAQACGALANLSDSAGDSRVVAGKWHNQMTRVLSPEACATVSRSVDIDSLRLVLESTNVLPRAVKMGLVPQVVTREACATAADSDNASSIGEMATCLGDLPQEIRDERMPVLLTPHATGTVGRGAQNLTYHHVWGAACGAVSLPAETRASALADILSPENCGLMAQSGNAMGIRATLETLGVLPQPLRGERERLILTEQARETVIQSQDPLATNRALSIASTWPLEHRLPALSHLLWPGGTPRTCELVTRLNSSNRLTVAIMASACLEGEIKTQVMDHLLTPEMLRMMAERAPAVEWTHAARAIEHLPPARRADAAKVLLSDRMVAEMEHGTNPLTGAYVAASGLRAARFLPRAEQAPMARKLLTPKTLDNLAQLSDPRTWEYCQKNLQPWIAALPPAEQAKWRAALARPPAEWQSVMAAAARPGAAAGTGERIAGAPTASRSADAAAPGGP
jgi:hypothetical protein